MQHIYLLGKENHPANQSTTEYVRQQLDRLEIGADLKVIQWGTKKKSTPLYPPDTHSQLMRCLSPALLPLLAAPVVCLTTAA
jgi:hypothetical protein